MTRPVGSAAAITDRLRAMSRASHLTAKDRLAAKVDMSPAAVTRRLRAVSSLRASSLAWQRVGRANGLGGVPDPP